MYALLVYLSIDYLYIYICMKNAKLNDLNFRMWLLMIILHILKIKKNRYVTREYYS